MEWPLLTSRLGKNRSPKFTAGKKINEIQSGFVCFVSGFDLAPSIHPEIFDNV